MWSVRLFCFSCLVVQVTPKDVTVTCLEVDDFPPTNVPNSPSRLADLKVELVRAREGNMMNISWAINIDVSIEYLKGTRITGETVHHCEYDPPLAELNLTGSNQTQMWFSFLVEARYGINLIQAANIPLPPPGSGLTSKYAKITIPRPPPTESPPRPSTTAASSTTHPDEEDVAGNDHRKKVLADNLQPSAAVAIFGGLAGLMILGSCCIINKICGSRIAASLGFKRLPTSGLAPVSVLMVYPPENVAFQRAVVALAEFLQWHGGCSVVVDMWQQQKIAELGPMRWLAEQAKATERVLVVCPQPSHSQPKHSLSGLSIPAAAHDLYPLILNMVAGHAKNASELSKFWAVQLAEGQDRRPCNLPPELRACRSFRLMKDLSKLCRSLSAQRQSDKKKDSHLSFGPVLTYSEKSTANLREAVEKLSGPQPLISREPEIVITV